jgi:hypothetical protein
MAKLTVRPARPEDMLSIEQLRDAYYTVRKEPVQIRNDAMWMVAEYRGRIVAAQSTIDAGQNERWQMDLYSDPTRAGRLGVSAIMNEEHERADNDGVTLIGVVASDNEPMLRVALSRGWRVVGTMLYRSPGEKTCQE